MAKVKNKHTKLNKVEVLHQCTKCHVFLISNSKVVCTKHQTKCGSQIALVKFLPTTVTLERLNGKQVVEKANSPLNNPPKRRRGRPRKSNAISPDESHTKETISRKPNEQGNGIDIFGEKLGEENVELVEGIRKPRRSCVKAKEKLKAVFQELESHEKKPRKSLRENAKDAGSTEWNENDNDKVDSDGDTSDNDSDSNKTTPRRRGRNGKSSGTVPYVRQKSTRLMDDFYILKCTQCPTRFYSKLEQSQHMKSIHESGKPIMNCPVCSRAFCRRTDLHTHIIRHLNAESVEKAFNLWKEWPSNSKSAGHKNPQFCCKFCLIRHTHHLSFTSHMKNQHPDKSQDSKFPCPYSCETMEDTIKSLLSHIKNEHKEKYYGPVMLAKLGSSISTNFASKKLECDMCGKMIQYYYRNIHKEICRKQMEKLKTKKFQCPICKIGAKDRYKLRTHFVMHLENNPFVCKFPGCGKKCSDEYYLQSHVKNHTRESFITCPKCDITYKN